MSHASTYTPHIAKTSRERERCYKLRHIVYCEKFKFEPANEKKKETDRHDNSPDTIHIYLTPPNSVTPHAYMRFLQENSGDSLQFEDAYRRNGHSLTRAFNKLCGDGPRIEISRFCKMPDADREITPQLVLCSIIMLEQLQAEGAALLSEAGFVRHLEKMGLDLRPMGHEIEFHGKRCALWMPTAQDKMIAKHPANYQRFKKILQGDTCKV